MQCKPHHNFLEVTQLRLPMHGKLVSLIKSRDNQVRFERSTRQCTMQKVANTF